MLWVCHRWLQLDAYLNGNRRLTADGEVNFHHDFHILCLHHRRNRLRHHSLLDHHNLELN